MRIYPPSSELEIQDTLGGKAELFGHNATVSTHVNAFLAMWKTLSVNAKQVGARNDCRGPVGIGQLLQMF